MSSISASTSPSSCTSALLVDDTLMGFGSEVNLSFKNVFEVQDQLCLPWEIKQEEDMWWWMEMQWEEQMLERDSIASVVNVQSARMAGEKVVVEIGKWWYSVSIG